MDEEVQYRGVVPLGGRWGARIVVETKHVWLGTYLEEKEAARNFDRVCLKLGRHRSLNFTPKAKELQFQLGYSLEAVILMVKERRYEKNYAAFLGRKRLTETSGVTSSAKKTGTVTRVGCGLVGTVIFTGTTARNIAVHNHISAATLMAVNFTCWPIFL